MLEKKKVLHIVTSMSWRGGEQQVAYLIDELKNDLDQFVICSKDSKFESYCFENEIKHFTYKLRRSIDFTYAKAVKEICMNESINICHLHDAHALTYAVIASTVFRNKTPLILSRRVDFPINNNWFSKFKYNHPSIVKIICVSQKILEITAKRIKDKSKLVTIYSGVDLSKFKMSYDKLRNEYNIPQDGYLVGNTSALADHKDYYTYIEVAKKLIEEDKKYYFIIIGDGPLKNEIVRYAEAMNIQNNLIFTGFREDVPEVLGELNTFLITSKTEGLGTSIIDAFASKVPVVATKAGGIPELVENEKTGLLCDIRDVNAISNAIKRIKDDAVLKEDLIKGAFLKAKEFDKKMTGQNTLKQYLKVFSKV